VQGKHGGPRVLYLIDSLALGGAERSLVDMAPRLVSAGVRLEVAVLHDRPGLKPELDYHGVRVHVVPGKSRSAWLWNVVELLRVRRPDLVHTTLFESDIVGRTAAAVARVPVVSTLANTPYGPDHAAEAGVSTVRLRGAQTADIITAKLVRRFHAVSQSTADACIARLRIPPDKIEVIPRGRDLQRLGARTAQRRLETRSTLGISGGTRVLLAVARQEPQKGLDVLLRALPRVLVANPDTVLLIAGRKGRASRELSGLASRISTPDAVRLLGSRDDVPDLLCAADVFVLPSRREGLPGSVLEAMALGVPIVASDLPTVREAVPGDDYAYLVPPDDPGQLADALGSVIASPMVALARAARAEERFLTSFDMDAVSRAMANFYTLALAGRRSGRGTGG
jgi:glycosyltransferase involved in cell wall biosynthesis